MMKKILKYEPDYPVAPGATLKEALEERGFSQSDFALRAGMTEKTVSQIINGMAPISVDTADKFELVLGVPATFWNQRELAYREAVTRIEELKKLEADFAWLKEVPVQELIDRECIEETSDKSLLVRSLLFFFGVSSVDAWRNVLANSAIQFRGGEAQKSYPGYVAAWRRIGVLMAQKIETAPFSAEEFKRALIKVRSMTLLPANEWCVEMPKACAAAGVAVVLVPEFAKASVSGAARFIAREKAMIQLSLKYKTDDQFWFTFFHEAGHLLLHGRKQFIDYGYSNETEEEQEANAFARNRLIPLEHAKRLGTLKSARQIKQFAESIGISPGIVVGRLQHDDFVFKAAFNDLKRKLEWK